MRLTATTAVDHNIRNVCNDLFSTKEILMFHFLLDMMSNFERYFTCQSIATPFHREFYFLCFNLKVVELQQSKNMNKAIDYNFRKFCSDVFSGKQMFYFHFVFD